MSALSLRNRGVTTAGVMIGLSAGRPARASGNTTARVASASAHQRPYTASAAHPPATASSSASRMYPRNERVAFSSLCSRIASRESFAATASLSSECRRTSHPHAACRSATLNTPATA